MKLGSPGASPWALTRETPIMRRRTTTMLNVKCPLSNVTLSCESFRSWFFGSNDTLKGSQNPGAIHIPGVQFLISARFKTVRKRQNQWYFAAGPWLIQFYSMLWKCCQNLLPNRHRCAKTFLANIEFNFTDSLFCKFDNFQSQSPTLWSKRKHYKGRVRLPNQMNFWKSANGGGPFQSKNYIADFGDFKQGF